jgi:hypothetical protein
MPLKTGSRREWTAKTFGAANRATKVTAAPIYGNHWSTTRGTPMLPRDLMIALMYGRAFALEMPDGTEMWSMQSRNDVSRSLDVLGKTEGAFLVRGPKFWETQTTPPGTLGRATIYRSTDEAAKDYRPGLPVPFNATAEDIGGFVNLSAHPTRLTIPAGVSLVQINANLVAANANTATAALIQITKNGGNTGPGLAEQLIPKVFNSVILSCSSGPLPVVEGDYFELTLTVFADGSVNVLADRSWISIRQL